MRLSYSQISAYEQCPQGYKLRYVDRVETVPGARLLVGVAVHDALAYFHHPARLKAPPLEEVLDTFCRQFGNASFPDEQTRQDHFEHGITMLTKYVEAHREQERRTISVELPFTVQIGEHFLSGRIDRVDAVGPEALDFIDYKTGRVPDQLQVDQDLQLALYVVAGEQLYPGKQVTPHLVFPAFGIRMTPRLSPERLECARLAVEKTAGDIAAGWFEPKVSGHCDWCEVKAYCSMFRVPEPPPAQKPTGDLLARYYEVSTEKRKLEKEQEALRARILEIIEQAHTASIEAGGYVARLNKGSKKVYDMARLRAVLEPLGLFDQVTEVRGKTLDEIAAALDDATRARIDTCWTRQESGTAILRVMPVAREPEEEDE